MPTVSISRSNHSRSGLRPAIESGSRMFSSASSTGSRLKVWKMKPISVAAQLRQLAVVELGELDAGERDACPRSGRSRPARMCISVDLPEPDGPMIAAKRPAGKLDA